MPGYAPTWTLRAGIEELYRGLHGAGLGESDWTGGRYYRLRTIKALRDRGILDSQLRYTA